LGLLVVCALSLAHAAHRFRFTLEDGLRLKRYDVLIATVCYGGALAGTLAAGYLLLSIH
jgi:fumarate reductase subunit D